MTYVPRFVFVCVIDACLRLHRLAEAGSTEALEAMRVIGSTLTSRRRRDSVPPSRVVPHLPVAAAAAGEAVTEDRQAEEGSSVP